MAQTKRIVLLTAIALVALVVGASIYRKSSPHSALPVAAAGTPLSGLSGATGWINTPPLTAADLKGKVVLVDFWTYSCINCLRTLPYMRMWADKYKDAGLVVLGIHSPEFGFEAELPKVERAVQRFGINYPVALDGKHAIWNAFDNEYWPAHYFLDGNGQVRHTHFGEGGYEESEKWIQKLLAERNSGPLPRMAGEIEAVGVEAPAAFNQVRSPETYIGYDRAQHFVSPGGMHSDRDSTYLAPGRLGLNEWGLAGRWIEHPQSAVLQAAGGKILFRFHARDLHLVLGPGESGKPARFRVTLDGHAPGEDHGVDIDAEGNGTVTEDRLYQLVRQKGAIEDHTFAIEFLDAGAEAFSFTFG